MLDRLIKITTILGTFLIFNGVLYLSIYYQYFDIKIFSYLDFTEILTSFIDSLQTILIFFIIYLTHLFLTMILTTKALENSKSTHSAVQKDISDNNSDNSKSILTGVNIGLAIQLIISIIFSFLILYDYWIINEYLIYFFSLVGFNILHMLVNSIENTFSEIFGKKPFEVFFAVLVFILPFTVYTISFAKFNAMKTKQNPKSITLIGKDNSITIAHFIGKTKNYIFLYDSSTNKSTSLSIDDIKAIEYN